MTFLAASVRCKKVLALRGDILDSIFESPPVSQMHFKIDLGSKRGRANFLKNESQRPHPGV
jgi:hypothetical protein